MSCGFCAKLAEILNLIDWEIIISAQVQQRIDQHRGTKSMAKGGPVKKRGVARGMGAATRGGDYTI